jgi:hypothetical protein
LPDGDFRTDDLEALPYRTGTFDPATNRVYVTNHGTSAKPSTSASVLDGTTNTIATTVTPNIGDVTAGIGSSAASAVTAKNSSAITSLGKTWSGQNVTIGQSGGTQLTNGFATMAWAMLVAIGLV